MFVELGFKPITSMGAHWFTFYHQLLNFEDFQALMELRGLSSRVPSVLLV